jgi:hypothetical protein
MNLGRLEYGNQCLDHQFAYRSSGSSQSGPLRTTFILADSLAITAGTCLHSLYLCPAGISFREWSAGPGPRSLMTGRVIMEQTYKAEAINGL